MNWARRNKLLAGFLVFFVIGVVALGYLLFVADRAFSETSAAYADTARELNRLRALKPFPNAENLMKEVERKEAFAARISSLQKKLNERELPVVPLTPEQFQDKLRQAVSKVSARAAEQSVMLPEGFYLGFQEYRDALPTGKAASFLGRQLDAIQKVVAIFLDNRVDAIGEIERQPLPEERRPARADEENHAQLVTRSPFRISMTGNHSTVRRVINTEVSAQQFYILRLLTLRNEELKGPERGLPVAAAELPASVQRGADGAARRIELLVGDERLTASFEIEIVDFAAPASEDPAAEQSL